MSSTLYINLQPDIAHVSLIKRIVDANYSVQLIRFAMRISGFPGPLAFGITSPALRKTGITIYIQEWTIPVLCSYRSLTRKGCDEVSYQIEIRLFDFPGLIAVPGVQRICQQHNHQV